MRFHSRTEAIRAALDDPTGEVAARQLAGILKDRAILAEGCAAATSGTSTLIHWYNGLRGMEHEVVRSHLSMLIAAATIADEDRERIAIKHAQQDDDTKEEGLT